MSDDARKSTCSSVAWKCKWGRRLIVFSIATFAFYGVEHWRGHREWKAFRIEWEAKGDAFNDRYPHLEIADSQNAAKIPLLVELEDALRDYPGGFSQNVPISKRGRLLMAAAVPRPEFKRWTNARGSWQQNQKVKFRDARWRYSALALGTDEASAAQAYLDAFGADSAILAPIKCLAHYL